MKKNKTQNTDLMYEVNELRADNHRAYEEIQLKQDRISELERTIICLAIELAMARNLIRTESAINQLLRREYESESV